MFSYYLRLALGSLRRNKTVTALMIAAIGLGIGACMTMLTVLHVMSADPLPGSSATLFHPQIEPRDAESAGKDAEPPDQLAWSDAMNLLRDGPSGQQAAMSAGRVVLRAPGGERRASFVDTRFTTPGFFSLFGVPFLDGHGWSDDDEEKRARVVVLGQHLAERLFGNANEAVGHSVRLGDADFRVIGVIRRWQPVPLFYDIGRGAYAQTEDIFMPLHTAVDLHVRSAGSVICWGDNAALDRESMATSNECVWLQLWVRLNTTADVEGYRHFLVNYSREQKALGRFALAPNVRLRNVTEWLAYNRVVPGGVQLQALLAVGFLLVCMVNTVALMLVKFTRRSAELSVRRAMGARKLDVFMQLLVEAAIVGVSGGAIGLALAHAGLWIVRQQPSDYASFARMDVPMLLSSVALAVAASLAAAVFPAWRTCRLPPALAIKIQ